MSNNEESNFEIILRVFAQELYETVAFDVGLRSVLGLLIRGGLNLALGPLGFFLPFAGLATFATRAGFKSWQEIQRVQIAGTSYDVHTTRSGLLVAENLKPSTLQDMPLLLPEYYETSLENLLTPKPIQLQQFMNLRPSLRQIDGYEVIQPLNQFYFQSQGYTCSECSKWIPSFGSSETCHAVYCSKNPNRATEWCDECKTDLTKSEHKDTCSRSPVQRCGECGNIIDVWLLLILRSSKRMRSKVDDPLWKVLFPEPYQKPSETLNCLLWDPSWDTLGHDPKCSKNPIRDLLWCDECETLLSPSLPLAGPLGYRGEEDEKYISAFLNWLRNQLEHVLGHRLSYYDYISQPAYFRQLWHQSRCSRNPFRDKDLCLRDMMQCSECGQDLILGDHKPTCAKRYS